MGNGGGGMAAKRLCALLGAVLFCALAGETAVRLLAPFPDYSAGTIHSFPDCYHPLLGYTGIPNLDTVFTLPDFTHRVRNNSRGFRDRERTPEKGGMRRIVVIGDSTAWGWGVEPGERFSDLMAGGLPGWEVINLSQAGYSTDQELLLLETEGFGYRPDIVFLLFDRNDVVEGNNAKIIDGIQPKPWYEETGGALALRGVPVPCDRNYWARKSALARLYGGPPPQGAWERFRDKVLTRSQLYNWCAFRVAHPLWKGEGEKPEDTVVLEERMGLTKRLLARMNLLCAERGARLVIADVPSAYTPLLAAFCRGEGIPFLDLRPVIEGRLRPVAYRRVGHWNRYGHRLVADAAIDFLKRNGLLDAR